MLINIGTFISHVQLKVIVQRLDIKTDQKTYLKKKLLLY